MDQNSTGGSDKRNWRERLGIGTKDNVIVTKDLPRVSGEFQPAAAPAPAEARSAATPAVRPAPMAPRPAARPAPAPGSARPAAPAARQAPIAPDALANKLKSQRDAAEKLAEQRVIAAKQRAEANLPHPASSAEKPKFTFADDDGAAASRAAAPTPPPVQRSAPPPPQRPAQPAQPPAGYNNQIAPPRPPLGGTQAVPPRAVPPPSYAPQPPQYPQGQGYPGASAYPTGQPYYPPQQPSQYPQGYGQQGYAPPPPSGYRPIDPATGYTPPPPFNPQSRQGYAPANQGGAPRLQVPQRPPVTGFNSPQAGFGADGSRGNPRLNNPPPMRQAPAPSFEGEEDDIFEQPAPRAQRRATADDYSQAYREVETGYEDEAPRSRGPLILLGVVALALIAGLLAVWGYTNFVKNGNQMAGQGNVPVVAAPDKAAKTTPDATTTGNATAGKAANSSKKLIYDRIVGDHEVPGGQLVPTEETPVQPSNNSAGDAATPTTNATPVPVPDAPPAAGATGTGDDGTPLPLPPPPGGTDGTQGSLEPSGKADAAKTDQAAINPAAGTDPAAAVPPAPGTQIPGTQAAGSEAVAPAATASKPAAALPAPAAESEAITPPEPAVETPVVKKPVAKKVASADAPAKSLGAKPVVLVPPAKVAPAPRNVGTNTAANGAGGGLYGDDAVGGGQPVVDAPVATTPAEPVKKRKTLLDLFKTDNQTGETETPVVAAPSVPDVPNVPAAAAPKPVQQVANAAKPAPAPAPSAGTGAYVAQLASFRTKAEANAEYSRLAAKHGQIIQRYAPIIEQAQVAGSTRYRLNIGPMASSNVATSFCSSLFAAGERDCLVHRQ